MEHSLLYKPSHDILSFTEFIKLKEKAKQEKESQSREAISQSSNLQTSNKFDICSFDEFLNMKKGKSTLTHSEIQNQSLSLKESKLLDDLKLTHSLIEEKLRNDLKLAKITNEENSNEINQLITALKQEGENNEKLQINCSNYQKLNEKLKEMNTYLQSQVHSNANQIEFGAKIPTISDQSEDIKKILEVNRELKEKIADRDRIIQDMSNKSFEKEKILEDITKMKQAVDEYSIQIKDMYEQITNRDKIILELKQLLASKQPSTSKDLTITEKDKGNNSNDNDQEDYKMKYMEQVQMNLKMKQSFEEITGLVKSLMESKEKEKTEYAKQLNENVIKENTELKKLNQMYKSKFDIIPKLEKRFEEVFHENNMLKDENKSLRLMQMHQTKIEGGAENKEDANKAKSTLKSKVNKQLEQSIGDTFTLYSIHNSSLLAFYINRKEYKYLKPKNIEDFKANYQQKGSITYNTFEGLFIITGTEFNKLYYYSQKQNTISSIMAFKENHQYGTLFLDDISKNLLLLSGKQNNLVECLSFEKTELSFLPSLNIQRAKASCCFINSVLYVFFGLNNQSKQALATIESLDMKSLNKESKWEMINLKSKDGDDNLNAFVEHSVLNYNDKQILILGGTNQKNMPNENIFFVDLSQKVIGELSQELGKQFENGDCMFSTHSMFRVLIKEDNVCYVNIDDNHNVHMMDSNLAYNLVPFEDKDS